MLESRCNSWRWKFSDFSKYANWSQTYSFALCPWSQFECFGFSKSADSWLPVACSHSIIKWPCKNTFRKKPYNLFTLHQICQRSLQPYNLIRSRNSSRVVHVNGGRKKSNHFFYQNSQKGLWNTTNLYFFQPLLMLHAIFWHPPLKRLGSKCTNHSPLTWPFELVAIVQLHQNDCHFAWKTILNV